MNENEVTKKDSISYGWLRRNLLSLFIPVVVILLTVVLVLFREQLIRFKDWGYPGAFLIGLTSNATIGVPMPLLVLLIPIASVTNPLFIGLVAGVGGAAGEMTAYAAGYAGRLVWQDNRAYKRAKDWVNKWGCLLYC